MSNPTPILIHRSLVDPEGELPDARRMYDDPRDVEQVAVFFTWTPFTYERGDGSQILVAVQPDGTVHVAERSGPSGTWGPPLDLVDR